MVNVLKFEYLGRNIVLFRLIRS